jgi:branched-subunit amino acid transport protein
MSAWSVIIAVGVGTYVMRSAMFVVLGNQQLPAWTARPLAFVGPAAIGALVGGMVLTDHGRFAMAGTAELVAVAAAFVTVRRTGDVARGMLVGFPVLWALAALGL